ncbi:hypothetical protein [Phycicoccus sp. 3266]|jgi:hypothetical protein|uniref:hypothetical protein n=1 Tax=Phycicoccus sp. 3266 TaxID=2817751 RepID=UPI00285CDC9B|nr:hypothetical protein [Phycicoccus sp. 3266]MDR6863376.1 hypothetical protein [Phycicoccus sp. 3266]
METYESHLQPDGTTFPPVTPDVPAPPGVDEPVVPDLVFTDRSTEASTRTRQED